MSDCRHQVFEMELTRSGDWICGDGLGFWAEKFKRLAPNLNIGDDPVPVTVTIEGLGTRWLRNSLRAVGWAAAMEEIKFHIAKQAVKEWRDEWLG